VLARHDAMVSRNKAFEDHDGDTGSLQRVERFEVGRDGQKNRAVDLTQRPSVRLDQRPRFGPCCRHS
jgi:hypothetical protein